MIKRNISAVDQCVNCGACVQVCPVGAIRVDESDLFYEMALDEGACVDCGRCIRACPILSQGASQAFQSAHFGQHKEFDVVKTSSSGGAFSALSASILAEGGVVYGACFDKSFRKVVIRSTDEVPLSMMLKSKYVESLVGDSFLDARRQLSNGREVLFCGAPCQIAGLKGFLGRDYPNLYTCDFLCGGFPSHQMYRAYIDSLERRRATRVSWVDFRPKTMGWETYAILVRFADGSTYHRVAELDPFFAPFLRKRYSVRASCLGCRFSDDHHSDIVLADFWAHREFVCSKKRPAGISLVFASSEKGEALLNRASSSFRFEDLDLERVSRGIKRRGDPADIAEQRDLFIQKYRSDGLWEASKTYCFPPFGKAVLIELKSRIKSIVLRVK